MDLQAVVHTLQSRPVQSWHKQHINFMLVLLILRERSHYTGITFISVLARPGPNLWLRTFLHDTGTKCRAGTTHLYEIESPTGLT